MKKPIGITVDEKIIEKIDNYKLTKDIGRSGVVRVAISEYFERREKLEKEHKSENSESE